MDTVDHPLDWWVYGGYPEVMRQLGCSRAQARRRVKHHLKRYYQETGDPIWRPRGHRGYEQLRRALLRGGVLDEELV